MEKSDALYELVGFPSIKGKILILGNSVAFGSMEKGFFYVDDGNDFWKLLDYAFYDGVPMFESLRIKYKNGNMAEREKIKESFLELLDKNNVGLSDVIYTCTNRTRSKDETIITDSIKYNPQLLSLISECEVVVINGVGDTKRNFLIATKSFKSVIKSKKVFYLGSSSNYRGLTIAKKEKRKEDWKKVLCWYKNNH